MSNNLASTHQHDAPLPAQKTAKRPRRFAWQRIHVSLRLELLGVVALSLLISLTTFGFVGGIHVGLSSGLDKVMAGADQAILEILNRYGDLTPNQERLAYLDKLADYHKIKIAVVDEQGQVVMRSSNFKISSIDIPALQKVMQGSYQAGDPFYRLHRVTSSLGERTIVVMGMPEGGLGLTYSGDPTMALLAALGCFVTLFLILISRKLRYLERLAHGLQRISTGDLSYRVEQRGSDELGNLALHINNMAEELGAKIKAEREQEQAKLELVTNLSHDIRTPLTSIMGYLRLLRDGSLAENDQARRYLGVIDDQAARLSSLVDQLFEYVKLADHQMVLAQDRVNLNELLLQLIEEFTPVCEDNGLILASDIPRERIVTALDPRLFVRALENVLTNATRYSQRPGTIKIDLNCKGEMAIIGVHNEGDPILPEDLEHIFDRFYRLDQSRNSQSGGSGLGLAIVRSIVELHSGQVWAECSGRVISIYMALPVTQ